MRQPFPHRRRALPACASLALSLLALGTSSSARAYEDQLTLGVGAGYGAAVGAPAAHGVVGDLSVSMGLSPELTLRARGSYGAHPGLPTAHVGLLSGELLYLVDVLELVPYAGVGVGGALRVTSEARRVDAEAHLVLGCDYLVSRELLLELDARALALPTDFGGRPLYLTVGLAVVFVFDAY